MSNFDQFAQIQHEYKDDFEWIRVIDTWPDNVRYLYFEDSIQGALDLANHHLPVLEYIGVMANGAKLLTGNPRKVVLGGLGAGALLHTLHDWLRTHGQCIAIESSSRVLEIGKKFFGINAAHKVKIGDYREKMAGPGFNRCDLIFTDCYSATALPSHLTTLEFFTLLYERLAAGGWSVFNFWNQQCNQLLGDQIRTLLEVFGEVGLLACTRDDNVIVFAGREQASPWPDRLVFDGEAYVFHVVSLEQPNLWPNFMEECDIITDDNLGSFIQAVQINYDHGS